jgi:uncharacterized protein YbaA (DUF1428 family)
MPRYVDGFIVPMPKRKLEEYRALSRAAGRVWMEHGALEYRESVGDDLHVKSAAAFRRGLRLKRGETVVFSWIVYRSRAHRDRVNARVMKDARITRMMEGKKPPFDPKRMGYGGFRVFVDL